MTQTIVLAWLRALDAEEFEHKKLMADIHGGGRLIQQDGGRFWARAGDQHALAFATGKFGDRATDISLISMTAMACRAIC